ncbi:mediator of RNA polymerase II transcription subunit 13 [Iris pallida]|uniref:Mediator of RNA polymerase II transcription subunit 13 n=1 Tax=Iris pallida TaxID=29817 RepID=A0AAX6HA89_IRIPA|nr:mediator of RNA polymerase II transcription subunit 13 [Iris pallida]
MRTIKHYPITLHFSKKTFIFPAETVLVPLLHRAFARFSSKRFCPRGLVGSSPYELWPLSSVSGSSYVEHCLAFGSTCDGDFLDGIAVEFDGKRFQRLYNSCTNSNSSSISSINSTSSDDDPAMTGAGDLEADADSLSYEKSGLPSNAHFENDGRKLVSKRPRIGITDAFDQAGTISSMAVQDISEATNSASVGLVRSQWDDVDRGFGINIQMIMSEFGDFGDFFENDVLTFGEPPGTAESQALVIPSDDFGDVSVGPIGGMDVIDQNLSPVPLTSGEGHNLPSGAFTEDTCCKTTDYKMDSRSSIAGVTTSAPLTGKFDYLTKAEAMMTLAPEFAAVEAPSSEFSSSIFKCPYLPRSKRVESLKSTSVAYVYSLTPPSPLKDVSEENFETSVKVKSGAAVLDSDPCAELYKHVQNVAKKVDTRSLNNDIFLKKGRTPSSLSSLLNSPNSNSTLQKKNGHTFEAGHFLLSLKTVLATEVECMMFQAAMCRIRHTLVSLSKQVPFGFSKLDGSVTLDVGSSEAIAAQEVVKKKDPIPARIAGDVDAEMLDGPLTTRVGVWRSVGAPKVTKPSNARIPDNLSSLSHNTLNDDGLSIHGQRQPLRDLLDAMVLLVQQSTSMVDVCLDMNSGDGSYCWLALQEQKRRGFSCGPSMVHAGCGGLLATCHSVDIAGVDLIDPLSADVQVSSVISLLQSDIKGALKSAFGSLDGPLSLIDWCKGRSQSVDSGGIGDVYSFSASDSKDLSSSVTLAGEPMSPSQSTGGSSSIRDGARIDESSQRRLNEICNSESEQKCYQRCRPTVAALPLPAILVGYQDDWLKTSNDCLQLWEKAPLEPYALPKPVTFYALCPDIDLLTSAAGDFFLQLGTVYETCNLGTHSPQISGGQTELSPGKCLSSGLVLVDCPQQVKIAGNDMFSVRSISDYFLSISRGWNVKLFIHSLTKVIKDLKLSTCSSQNQKEGSTGPSTVVYVVCPFPEPTAVLQTLIESSAALGSVISSSDRERQALLHSQVAKALSSSAAADDVSASNILMLSGFSIPKLVLQIVTVECLLRVNRPQNDLAVLKDIAFTVYNKARRIPRAISSSDIFQSSTMSGRSHSSLMHLSSAIPGLWKDCLAPRMSGQTLSRDGELDSALRSGTWDNSWTPSRTVGVSCEPNRSTDLICQDDMRYMFEPLFILAEPGSVQHGASPNLFGSAVVESSNLKSVTDDSSGMYIQSSASGGSTDVGTGSQHDGLEHGQKSTSLHCCYGWTEDWRWLVCIWTDSRGELLDCNIFPFGGISSRQDTKVLQSLFVQVLNQGCQILSSSSPDSGSVRARDIIITRIGCFFELECQEWQNAIYLVGGSDVKKWTLQLRRPIPDSLSSNTNGSGLQQQEMGLIQERTLPSSPSSSLYSPRAKSSFVKGVSGQTNTKSKLLAGQTGSDNSRGLLQFVQSISLVGVSIDHSMHLILPADSSTGGGTQNSNSSNAGFSAYFEGFSPVKSLGSMSASYILIPSPNMRSLSKAPMQLPTCLTSESPPLAHLLHSKGSAIPLSTGYVVSKAVPSMRKDPADPTKEDWPSVLAVTLIDHYGGGSSSSSSIQEKMARGGGKEGRRMVAEANNVSKDYELETHTILESVAAELHSLSWMTASPMFLERRTALPFHCDLLLRLRRLLHYADKKLSRPPERRTETTT